MTKTQVIVHMIVFCIIVPVLAILDVHYLPKVKGQYDFLHLFSKDALNCKGIYNVILFLFF